MLFHVNYITEIEKAQCRIIKFKKLFTKRGRRERVWDFIIILSAKKRHTPCGVYLAVLFKADSVKLNLSAVAFFFK